MCALFLFSFLVVTSLVAGNNSPIVGILTLPCSDESYYCVDNPKATSYLPSAYVKWIESGGARVIPLIADDSFNNINELIPQLNGILITGGAAGFTSSSFWWTQLNNILDNLRKFHANKQSDAIPLWATCLGFEGVQCAVAGTTQIKISRESVDKSLAIDYTSSASSSQIFDNSYMPKDYASMVYDKAGSENITYNHHSYGISPSAYNNASYPHLKGNFSVLGTNVDEHGYTFVSLIESQSALGLYWYGSQFHPEKPQFIFDSKSDHEIIHTLDSILVNGYFGQFFVNECKVRNNNQMNENTYDTKVIFNYGPYFVANGTKSYEQVYLFQKP